MIIPLFAIAISTVYFLSDYFTLLYRLLKKMTKKTNTYKVPQLVAHDYPLPPFPNTWYPICLSSELKTNAVQNKKIAGNEFVLFRDEKGVVSAIDKNCPHMGVDLSYGTVKNGCVVCPFHGHCVKPADSEYFIEETNNIIFIWIGDRDRRYSIKDLAKTYNCPEGTPFLSSLFTRNVGGHLIDYAEHLLDVHHAPYIHGVKLKPVENSLVQTKTSFVIQFCIEETNVKPVFIYITPTFGYIEYSKDVRIYMMFIVYDVGNIDMVVLPCGNNILQLFYSLLGAVYTQIDFADEAAYFSTKNHHIRNLRPSEKPMDDFRKWFIDTYYTEEQLAKFAKVKVANDW
jgi:nitrite reductase/ring-hydroxylating ferredoxin subunit